MSVLAELGKLGEVGERANNTNSLVLSAFLNTESIFGFVNIIFDTLWAWTPNFGVYGEILWSMWRLHKGG